MRLNFKRLFIVATLFSLSVSLPMQAQVRTASNPQAGKFYDGLFKDLRNSYLLNNTPLQPVPPASTSSAVAPQTQQIRSSLQGFATSAGKLVAALRFEERYSPNIRILLADAANVQARAYSLAQNADRYGTLDQLAEDYSNLDRIWRLLAYQLQQTPNIGSNVTTQVNEMNRWNQQLAQLTKVSEPQLQVQDLSRHFIVLWSDLEHMVDDMRYELAQNPAQAQLISEARELANRARQLQMAADRGYPHSEIVRYYEPFFDSWRQLKRKLRTVSSRQMQSFIDRVAMENDHIHELLLLEPVIDGRDILFMADSLQQNVNMVCDTISLRRLLAVPNSVAMYQNMQEFYALCSDFRQTVSTETNVDNVVWDFRELDVAWNDLKSTMIPLAKQDTSEKIAYVDKYVSDLRHALRLQPSVNNDQAVQLASSLDNLSGLLKYDISRFVRNYPSQFRNTLDGYARSFNDSARAVYELSMTPNNAAAMRPRVQDMARNWHQLEEQLAKVRVEDRSNLVQTAQSITPTITKLQVMYGY